jgi:hypothetical protein
MQNMMKQAQQMQERMQQEVAQIRVEASSGGGMVTVKMDGHKNVLAVKIDPEVAGDVEMLQDMVVAACNEAVKKVDDETKQKMSGIQTPARHRPEIGAAARLSRAARVSGGCAPPLSGHSRREGKAGPVPRLQQHQ